MRVSWNKALSNSEFWEPVTHKVLKVYIFLFANERRRVTYQNGLNFRADFEYDTEICFRNHCKKISYR